MIYVFRCTYLQIGETRILQPQSTVTKRVACHLAVRMLGIACTQVIFRELKVADEKMKLNQQLRTQII
jgi:hypothetical protein